MRGEGAGSHRRVFISPRAIPAHSQAFQLARVISGLSSVLISLVTVSSGSRVRPGFRCSAIIRPASFRAKTITSWSVNTGPHSTSRITLRRFIRLSACTTSFLSSTASRRCTVRVGSHCPGSMYSPRMRLASSMARRTVSWSGLFMTPRNSLARTWLQD